LADGEQVQIIPGAYEGDTTIKHLIFIIPLLVVLALVSIGGPLYPAPRFVFSAYRNIWVIVKLKDVFKRKNGTQTPDDEADVTLVDESVSQVIFIKESESSCAVSSSPVLSTSQPAPVVTSVDESSCRQGQRLQLPSTSRSCSRFPQ
jgi:hypothetical protein